jgi:hypothetical protein
VESNGVLNLVQRKVMTQLIEGRIESVQSSKIKYKYKIKKGFAVGNFCVVRLREPNNIDGAWVLVTLTVL